ncbi:MAG: cob(I)yrinic acid a,c-diamide adenosyltransferase [archaeon]
MPKISSAYTGKGDKGNTSFFGAVLSKSDLCFDVVGDIDELNSSIGVCRGYNKDRETEKVLQTVQKCLFRASAYLAGNKDHELESSDTKNMEKSIDFFNAELPELKKFILPDGCELASHLQLARAVCRRAERKVVSFREKEPLPGEMLKYFNRLSSLLFVLARWANKEAGIKEAEWTP